MKSRHFYIERIAMKKQSIYIGGSNIPNLPPGMLNDAMNVSAQSVPAMFKGVRDSVLKDGMGSFAGKAIQKPLPKALANIAGSVAMLAPGVISTPLAILNVLKNWTNHIK